MDTVKHTRLLGTVANLSQALLGAITPNFRAVSVELSSTTVRLNFLIERDNAADREEIDDVIFEYEALEAGMPKACEVIATVFVSPLPMALIEMPGYRVFGRKE
jgi:hypothetical protein